MSAIAFLIPLFIGAILGLIGGGGSVLAVPALVYIFGLEAKTAIAVSLFVVGIISLIAVINHKHKSNIPIKKLIPFTLAGMLGSYISANYIAAKIPDSIQLIIFAIMVLTISLYMFFKKETPIKDKGNSNQQVLISILIGFILGSITGIIGVGGGFLIVPALIIFLQVPLHTAIASSLVIIAAQALTGFFAYINFVHLDYKFMSLFTLTFILGAFIGAKFSSQVPAKILNKVFALTLFLIGIFVV